MCVVLLCVMCCVVLCIAACSTIHHHHHRHSATATASPLFLYALHVYTPYMCRLNVNWKPE